MDIVIMAGGKGTRIASVAADIPKPMIPVEGKPILQRLIETLVSQNFKKIKIVTGHLGHIIEQYFRDGKELGCDITYFHENEPLGTAGALYYFIDELSDDFFLLNADALMDIDFKRMASFHAEKKGGAAVLVHPNNHPFDSSIVKVGKDSVIDNWFKKGELKNSYKNRINAGVHILNKHAVSNLLDGYKKDLDKEILMPLVAKHMVYAYESTEYIKDMGTPERYREVCEDLRNGKTTVRNLANKQKAVFLDRDGTLNVYKGFVTKPEQIELIGGVEEAVKKINHSEYLAIVISNQPVIARGECTFEEVDEINGRLEALLGESGAYLDDVFYCPHHTDKGFKGERPELKINCSCRKPKPGLLEAAAKKYNIDLSASYMVGDSAADILAGAAVNCTTVYIGEDTLSDEINPDLRFSSLKEFADNKLN